MIFVFRGFGMSFYRQPGRIFQYEGDRARRIGRCCNSAVILLAQIVDV